MGSPLQPRYNRSNLFLVRLWLRNDGNTNSDSSKVEWCGKLQRVVDGEAHQFTNLQELVALLETMVLIDN